MHILYLPSWYPATCDDVGGSFFREQAIAMQAAGAKVGIISPALSSLRAPGKALLDWGNIRFENDAGMSTFRVSIPNITPWSDVLSIQRIAHQANRLYKTYVSSVGKPDLIHVQAALSAGLGATQICKRENLPLVLQEHGSGYARNLYSPAAIKIAYQVAKTATARFVVSAGLGKVLIEKLGDVHMCWSTLPNSVSSSFLTSPVAKPNLTKFQIFHASFLDANKNVAVILHAFADQFRGNLEVELVIAGDGPEKSRLEQLAVTLGIREQVRFLGLIPRQHLKDAMALCHVFVLASKVETFGIVLIEAMALGKPVIATRCGGPEDIVTQSTGILVPVDDADAMGAAMKTTYQKRYDWNAASIREECEARFGSIAVTQRWLDVYSNIISQNHGARE